MSARPELGELPVGDHRITCPSCGRGPKDKTAGVTVHPDRTVFHCFRCGEAGAWRTGSERAFNGPTARPPATRTQDTHLSLASHWQRVWQFLASVRESSEAVDYLTARGCAIPLENGHLRYGVLPHPSGYRGPCLVGLVTDALTGEPLTLHRTWIKSDGTKPDIHPPRLLLGKHRKQGGVIRLFPDECVTTGLAIAEGIETALAVATAFKPVWSAIDAGNLAAFPVLGGVESLLIVADNDDAGIPASNECAQRWHEAGREVRIATPPERGTDAADLTRRRAAA